MTYLRPVGHTEFGRLGAVAATFCSLDRHTAVRPLISTSVASAFLIWKMPRGGLAVDALLRFGATPRGRSSALHPMDPGQSVIIDTAVEAEICVRSSSRPPAGSPPAVDERRVLFTITLGEDVPEVAQC